MFFFAFSPFKCWILIFVTKLIFLYVGPCFLAIVVYCKTVFKHVLHFMTTD